MAQAPVVGFATSKGGSGKSTTCILVAGEIAARGERVLILDIDPQQSTVKWFERCKAAGAAPERIEVVSCLGERALGDRLDHLPEDGLVLIDAQGALTPSMAMVAAKADLIVVPSRASKLDIVEAADFVKYTSHFRDGGVRLFLNEVDGIASRTNVFKEAIAFIVEEEIPYFRTMLQLRPIYRALTDNGGTLATMKADAEQIRKARANVFALTTEILEELSDGGTAPANVQEDTAALAVG
ncbi:ParA family protein [Microvirga tunisiensis]|uniref:ParA family protein n=1 Tax=Microvirga tunisiensis TaxID=2108360 RepID=A0A5N7MLN9_9HYPH|nr:ParA family protein [Microvirga tunisiensis]MPR09745.1 ParA family protein [Microvirga tunisiensis]MPR27907.1 ParA family protein [Microvirga tunisiensis]